MKITIPIYVTKTPPAVVISPNLHIVSVKKPICPNCGANITELADNAVYIVSGNNGYTKDVVGELPVCCGYAWYEDSPIYIDERRISLLRFIYDHAHKLHLRTKALSEAIDIYKAFKVTSKKIK